MVLPNLSEIIIKDNKSNNFYKKIHKTQVIKKAIKYVTSKIIHLHKNKLKTKNR
ncbi:hypothetical protein HanIR_Chr12g0566271 [Helianthus annuus]|nr:hypothetical protein HanIR_Chr12g0566271 [Helianthus annuus]